MLSDKPIRAIGLVNTDVSAGPLEDRTITEIARSRGYQLADVLTIDSSTYMPVSLIIHTAAIRNATAIVAPDIGHLGGAFVTNAVRTELIIETEAGTAPRLPGRSSTR